MLRSVASAFCLVLCLVVPAFSQKSKQRPVVKPAPIKRLTFAEAQKMLLGENEGNMEKLVAREEVTFTLTRFFSGQVLELYYPVKPNLSTGKVKVTMVPGYGVWYESETVFNEAKRPRHALEDMVPNTDAFIVEVPQLIARLEKRLRTKLDYSRASLHKLDALVATRQGVLLPTETDPRLFQELLAYYGETLRQALGGEWKAVEDRYGKKHSFNVPGLRYLMKSVNQFKMLKPGASVMNALFDDKHRGSSITLAFDKDMAAAQ